MGATSTRIQMEPSHILITTKAVATLLICFRRVESATKTTWLAGTRIPVMGPTTLLQVKSETKTSFWSELFLNSSANRIVGSYYLIQHWVDQFKSDVDFRNRYTMQTQVKTSLLLIAVLAFVEFHAGRVHSECSRSISPHEALDIANRAVKKAGFDLADLDATVTRDIQEWKDHVQRSIRGDAGEKAQEEAQQMNSVLQSYKNFFWISYQPKKHPEGYMRLGGVSVLLDADTGMILIIQPAHRKAIYPKAAQKKNKRQSEPCPSSPAAGR